MIELSVIKRVSLQSEIIEYIKNYIVENKLEAGDKLPSQMEMMEILGVSRASIREAFKTLEANNIVEIRNGKGVYYKSPSINIIMAEIEIGKVKEDYVDLYEVRKMLETEIITLVIKRASDEELEDIQLKLDRLIEQYNRGDRGKKNNTADKDFHMALYKSCHNKLMIQLIESTDQIIDKLWQDPLQLEYEFPDTIPLHIELLKAIKERNTRKAISINNKIINTTIRGIKNFEKKLKN